MALERHRLALTYVTAVKEDPETKRFQISTARFNNLWTADAAIAGKLERLVHDRSLTAISVSPERQIVAVVPAVRDRIMSVATQSQDSAIQVQAMRSPSMLALRTDHPRFAALLELLKQALVQKSEVDMAVFPGTGEIEDVIQVPLTH
jgi:hypothetical protein